LEGAAVAGSMAYKFVLAPSASDEGGFYASLTGPGSLIETYRTARGENESGLSLPGSSGGIGHVGNPYSEHRAGSNEASSAKRISNDDAKLLAAAAAGDKEAVTSRLAKKVRVDSRDTHGRSALMYAAWSGYEDICARLVAAGADVHLEDAEGHNALDYAAGRGLLRTVEALLNYAHAKDDRQYKEYASLMQAAYANDVTRLPEGTGNLVSINRINPDGQAPLFIAAGNGALPMMEALLARGARIGLQNSDGRTPLHWAAWNNQPQAVSFLLAHGADPQQADHTKNTALMLAAQHGSTAAARALLAGSADKYQANQQGKTAAMIAEDNGFKALAALLK
jgi:ankyrin repeat protein